MNEESLLVDNACPIRRLLPIAFATPDREDEREARWHRLRSPAKRLSASRSSTLGWPDTLSWWRADRNGQEGGRARDAAELAEVMRRLVGVRLTIARNVPGLEAAPFHGLLPLYPAINFHRMRLGGQEPSIAAIEQEEPKYDQRLVNRRNQGAGAPKNVFRVYLRC